MAKDYTVIYQRGYLNGIKELSSKKRYDLVDKVEDIVEQLQRKEITTQYHNHPLVDYGKKVYELHVEGDVLLVYEYVDDKLILNLLTITDHKELKNPTTKKNIKKRLLNSLEEDTQPRKINISKIPLTTFKKLAVTSNKVSPEQARDFRFATDTEPFAEIINETDKAYLINIIYYRWNKDRTGKDKSSILIWYPKSNLKRNFYLGVRENKGANLKINSKGIRESLAGNEYFTKEEIKTLPNELAKYFQDQPVPKYYDISVEDMGDKKYVLRGNIDYGDVSHDHRYFDAKAKEFFNDKGISVDIYEPNDLRDSDYGDDIYSSAHIIQKSGNRVYVPQENELDNFID